MALNDRNVSKTQEIIFEGIFNNKTVRIALVKVCYAQT